MNRKYAGVLAIICASVMWAIEPVLAKLSYHSSDFIHTSAIRAFIVTLVALAYMAAKRASPVVERRQLPVLAYIGIVGTLFADLLYFFAMTEIPVVNVVLIGHMQPVFIILIGFLLLKDEKLALFDYAGIALMMLSALMVSTGTIGNLESLRFGTLGDVLVFISTISWATAAIAVRRYLTGMNAGVIAFYRFMIASIAFAVYLSATSGITIANIYQVEVGIVVGVGTILYYEGLKRIKAAQVSAIELSAPFFAAVIAFVVLEEMLTPLQIAGVMMLFPGIYYLSKKEG
jgi:drug/metabolite transporter (DMT)-like permease